MEMLLNSNPILIGAGVLVLCFLCFRMRLGLLVAYGLTFYWGFLENRATLFTDLETASPYIVLYFISGVALVGLTLLSFVTSE